MTAFHHSAAQPGDDNARLPNEADTRRLEQRLQGLQRAHDAFMAIAGSAIGQSGDLYFQTLVRGLAQALEMDMVVVGEVAGAGAQAVETTAAWLDGQIIANFRYDLRGTPCEQVVGRELCVFESDVQRQFPDDRYLVELGIQSYIGAPLFDSAGKALGLFSALGRHPIRDTAFASLLLSLFASHAASELQRRRSEQARHQSEQRLQLALEAAHMAVWDWDVNNDRVTYSEVNERQVKPSWQSVGQSNEVFMQAVHVDDRTRVAETIRSALAGESHFAVEFRQAMPHGPYRWMRVQGRVQFDAAGKALRMLGVVFDIEERKREEEERRQLDARVRDAQRLESLGALAGGVAHDFNNLIQAILSNAGLAQAHLPPASEGRACLEQIETASLRASELTSQLLSYTGKGRLVFETVNLSALALEMLQLLDASIGRRARVLGHFAPALPGIDGDPTQLRQLIMNLIINAAEALGEGLGLIRLSTGAATLTAAELAQLSENGELPAGDYVLLEVEDTGRGMSAEVRQKIFEPFFTTKATGRGLGLAAVRGIVRAHRGVLQVDSEPGAGTRMRLYLPAVDRPAPANVEPAPAAHEPPSRQCTILVVDDESAIRRSARMQLEMLGFTAITAADGPESLRIFAERRAEIAAVVLDLTMPHMAGDRVFIELRRLRADVPIVLCSGYSENDVLHGVGDDGISAFLQKPYRATELKEQLLRVLRPAAGSRASAGRADGVSAAPAPTTGGAAPESNHLMDQAPAPTGRAARGTL